MTARFTLLLNPLVVATGPQAQGLEMCLPEVVEPVPPPDSFEICQASETPTKATARQSLLNYFGEPTLKTNPESLPKVDTAAPKPSAMGLAVSLIGSSLGIVAFDHWVVGTLIEKKIIPKEARLPASFGGIMGGIALFHKMGMIEAGAIESLRSMPLLMGVQTLVNLVMFDALKIKSDFVSQTASLTLAAAPMALASRSPALAAALGGGGASLTLKTGVKFGKLLGWMGVIDLAAGAGTWVIGRYMASGTGSSYDNNVRIWDTVRLCQFLYNKERYGATLASTFGSFLTAADVFFDQSRVEAIQGELVEGSDDLGNALNDRLMDIIARRFDLKTDGIDWLGAQEDIRRFYQNPENTKNIKDGYAFVQSYTSPLTQSGIADLVEIIDSEGSVTDLEGFQAYIHFRIILKRTDDLSENLETARSLGLMEGETLIVPETPTPEQMDFLTKTAALNTLEMATRPQ